MMGGAQVHAGYGESSANELFRKRGVGSSTLAFRCGRRPLNWHLDAGKFGGQRQCGRERRFVATNRRHAFDAPSGRFVIVEESYCRTGTRKHCFVGFERSFRHINRHRCKGRDGAPEKAHTFFTKRSSTRFSPALSNIT